MDQLAIDTTKHFDGDWNGLAEYESSVGKTYRSYLATRSQFYSSVARWRGSKFWKRRTEL